MKTGTGLSLLRLEVRRRRAFVIIPFFAGLTVYVALGEMPVGVWVWPYTSVALQSSLVLTGPLAAGLGAWIASRNRRHKLEELLITTPLPSAGQDLARWTAMTLWIISGYAIAAILLLVPTLLNAIWGTPNAAPIIAGLVAVAMWSSVGYLFGYFLPRYLTAVFVVITSYLVQGITAFFVGSYLSPVNTAVPDVFYGLWPQVSVAQSVFFAGVMVFALWIVIAKSLRGGTLLWITLAVALLPIFVSALVLLRVDPTNANQNEAAYEPVCEKAEITVCLHPAYSSLLPEVTTLTSEMTEPLSGAPEALSEPFKFQHSPQY